MSVDRSSRTHGQTPMLAQDINITPAGMLRRCQTIIPSVGERHSFTPSSRTRCRRSNVIRIVHSPQTVQWFHPPRGSFQGKHGCKFLS